MLNASVIIVALTLIVIVIDCQGAAIPVLSQRNGELTDNNEFLEFTSVRRITGDHLCGGWLIDADSLLTVASCLFDQSGRAFNIDELRVNIGLDMQRDINRIFIHPDFETGKDANNVALLHLNPAPAPIAAVTLNPINTALEPVSQYQKCTLVGWVAGSNGGDLIKRKLDVTFDSENVTAAFDSNECTESTAAALICNNMINGFLTVKCPPVVPVSEVLYVDVTQFNIWIDQIWRCELKPEIGGCQATTTTTMRATTEFDASTVVYNEHMDHTHDIITTMSTDQSTISFVTPPPQPAPEPEPVNSDEAEVGHVYHEHEHLHDFEHNQQNQRTHENYHSPPEQDDMIQPKASFGLKLSHSYSSFLAIIPMLILVHIYN